MMLSAKTLLLLLLGLTATLAVDISSDYEDDVPDITDETPDAAEKAVESADDEEYDDSEEGVGLRTYHRPRPAYRPSRPAYTKKTSSYQSCYSEGRTYSHGQRWYVGPCNNVASCSNGVVSRTYESCSTNTQGASSNCKCINPFSGYSSHSGDPDVTCNKDNNPFCYVDRYSDCRDKRPAKGGGRYYSRVACEDECVFFGC